MWNFRATSALKSTHERRVRLVQKIFYEFEIPDPSQPGYQDASPPGPSGPLVAFRPPALDPMEVVGRVVDAVNPYIGTYGMGGPGFFGIRLGKDWLTVAVWGAAAWMTAKGRLVEDLFYEEHGRERPWIVDGSKDLSSQIVGQSLESIGIRRHSLKIVFANQFDLSIEETADRRPVFEGNGEPRAFADSEDLRRGVFLSPTAEIWV